jgi:hypothetical protein
VEEETNMTLFLFAEHWISFESQLFRNFFVKKNMTQIFVEKIQLLIMNCQKILFISPSTLCLKNFDSSK